MQVYRPGRQTRRAWLAVLIATTVGVACAEDDFKLKVVANRANAIYQTDEQAKFLVSVTKGEQAVTAGEVSYVVDDFVTEHPPANDHPQGKLNLAGDLMIAVTSSKPGFLRCRVTFQTPDDKNLQATAAVGFSPENIPLSLPIPEDFDTFWADQKKQLAQVQLDAKLTPVTYKDDSIECFDVQITCLGDAPVSGYLARPKDAQPQSLPAILWVHGAGVGSSSLSNAVTGAQKGMLSLDINAHGIPNGQPAKFYQDLRAGRLNNYRYAGRENRETSYFRGMFLRLVRAIDFLTARPEWDGRVVAVIGHSQGGGQALVAGGLDDRVTFVATGVPAICDHSGRAAGRINGWPKLVPTAENGQPDATILQASRYLDAVNFASRCRADAIMSVGFIDAVCPPSSCYAAYNQLRGDKHILHEPRMGHAAPLHIKEAFLLQIQQHVQQRVQPAKSAETTTSSSVLKLSDAVRDTCLNVLRAGLTGEDFWPSIHAAEGLTLAGRGSEVISFLEPKLKTEGDDQKRCGLARELVRAGDWRKAAIMLDILASDAPQGHVHAAESLYKVGEIGDGDSMRQAAAQTENGKLQLMANAALARCGSPAAMKLVRNELGAKDQETSRTAAWILARIGDASDLPQLRMTAAAAKDTLTRCYSEHALAVLGDQDGLRRLEQNLSSDDPVVRTYAATFAGDARAILLANKLIHLLGDENLDVRVRAAQSLFVLSQPIARENEPQLVYKATKKHPRYTEGSIIRLNDSSLLYAVTQFVGSGSDFSQAQIVARRSSNGGRTWSEPRVLQESTGQMNVMSVTLRRLNRPDEATIAMFYLQKNSFDDLRVYVRFSHDEAESFGKPIRVTTDPGYHVMNNDRVTQLSSGRLLVPVASTADVHRVNHFISCCWLSDDRGRTWRKGKGQMDQPKRGAMEPEVIELRDGRVLMIARTQLGFIATSYSEDGGDTWSKPNRLSAIEAPEAPATLRRIPATGDLLLIWNNSYTPGVDHGGKRTPLTAAVSSDEGRTWRNIRNLETNRDNTYAYASLAFIKSDAVMSYWSSTGGQYSSRFRSVPVAWFYGASRAH